VTQGMMSSYPSGAWGLQWIDLFREEGLYTSRGLLRNVLYMCSERHDLYGLLEVLYTAQEEDANITSANRNDRRGGSKRSSSSGSGSGGETLKIRHGTGEYQSEDIDSEADSGGDILTDSDADGKTYERALRQRDWNKACLAAWHCRVIEMPPESFKSAFTEIMGLMREADVQLETSTSRTLLRFLVHTQPSSDITWKMLRRIYRDKSFPVCHIELVALSLILLKRIPNHRSAFTLASPLYRTENYLFVYPSALTTVRS
jgi:hypothetical protein